MSYIKIEIGGKERGLKFNQLANVILSEKMDVNNISATACYALVFAGLKANCYVKGEECDFTFEQVCDWVDELEDSVIIEINKCYESTQAFKKLLEKVEEIEDSLSKKKQAKRATGKNALK